MLRSSNNEWENKNLALRRIRMGVPVIGCCFLARLPAQLINHHLHRPTCLCRLPRRLSPRLRHRRPRLQKLQHALLPEPIRPPWHLQIRQRIHLHYPLLLVKGDNPKSWLNNIASTICSYGLNLEIVETFDEAEALWGWTWTVSYQPGRCGAKSMQIEFSTARASNVETSLWSDVPGEPAIG